MSIPVCGPAKHYTKEELADIVYPDEILEPLYVHTIINDGPFLIEALILERQYLSRSEKLKSQCRLATPEDLKGKNLGPRCYLENALARCSVRKGIPWSKKEC